MGEVAGTGKKPWRQKGTGRARAGSFRLALLAWAAAWSLAPARVISRKKVNRSTRQLALRKALSERLKAGDVIGGGRPEAGEPPRPRSFQGVSRRLEFWGYTTLLVVAAEDGPEPALASRNVPGVD
jgi:large subunit ribosomal protein L4